MFISADKPGSGCLHIAGYPLATTDGRDDRNLRSVGDGTRESTCISDIFVPNENIDMLPQLSLLRRDAISNTRVECPQSGQRVGQSCGRVFDLDFAAPASKVAQSARNVKDYRHDQLFLVGRDLRVDRDFDRDEIAVAALGKIGAKPPEVSATTAFRTQTTDGRPSSIFCHVLPSSREPKSCPLRVPK